MNTFNVIKTKNNCQNHKKLSPQIFGQNKNKITQRTRTLPVIINPKHLPTTHKSHNLIETFCLLSCISVSACLFISAINASNSSSSSSSSFSFSIPFFLLFFCIFVPSDFLSSSSSTLLSSSESSPSK